MRSALQMTKGSNTRLSVDELVATLKNSSLPTLLVEGKSDMSLFRDVEDRCFASKIDILPVGCRPDLLALFSRRSEFKTAIVAFLADADMFVFTPPPQEYTGIIFTTGYSIENDLLLGGKALAVLTKKHRKKWELVLDSLSHWFASVVHRLLGGESLTYNQHPNELVDFSTGQLKPLAQSVLVDRAILCPQAQNVLNAPLRFLRGHTLHDGLGHFLAAVKHQPPWSKQLLLHLEILSWNENAPITHMVAEVEGALSVV